MTWTVFGGAPWRLASAFWISVPVGVSSVSPTERFASSERGWVESREAIEADTYSLVLPGQFQVVTTKTNGKPDIPEIDRSRICIARM